MDIIAPVLPKSLRSWLCAIVLLILFIVGYYLYIFPILHSFYFGQEMGTPSLYSSAILPSKCEHLVVRVDSPRQVAPFVKRWVYLTLTNKTSEPITVTVSLSLTPSSGWYMPFLFGSSALETLSFSPLGPYATAHGQIPLFSARTTNPALTLFIVYIWRDQLQKCPPIFIEQPPLYNPGRALVHSFIEQILLPPWSNWFLAAIGLIIPALVDYEQEEKKKQSWWQMFHASLALSLTIFALVLLILSIIWQPIEKESGGMWNIVLIIVSFLILFLSWRRLGLDLLALDLPARIQDLIAHLKQKFLRTFLWRVIMFIIIIVLLWWLFSNTRFPLLMPLRGISLIIVALEFPEFLRKGGNQ